MMAGGETADYSCPGCNGHLVRDNTSAKRFRCQDCERRVHEAVVENVDTLRRVAEIDGGSADIARRLLETGGVKE